MPDTLIVSEENLGLRLDKLLAQQFPEHSRSYFQYLIDEKHVLLNGHPVKKQHRPLAGDEIAIAFQDVPNLDVKPEAIPLDIVYEDAHIIAVNKPVGMVVHPAPGAYTGTFANALMYHCKELNPDEFEKTRPGIVHRLDKETSGLLIGAKTLEAHKKLTEAFSKREVQKRYLAICCGIPKEGECSAPIKRHPIKRKQMTVSAEGKEALTRFKILARKDGLSLIEAELVTGRTHQIRVHLKHLNCPVLGDNTYGNQTLNQKYGALRQMLHAHQVQLKHPISEVSLELVAPIPTDLKNFIELIQKLD
ncbi:MAG: Ribosomal large subunit pseudouridine synthase D [Chlamydiae bacterium]|nr:Ribosomal large subunit pseudouridine synthase D [Chlamydiota bacterium]